MKEERKRRENLYFFYGGTFTSESSAERLRNHLIPLTRFIQELNMFTEFTSLGECRKTFQAIGMSISL
jgi:hypothetical protein